MLTITKSSSYTPNLAEHPETSINSDKHYSTIEKSCSHEKKSDEFQLKNIEENFPSLLNKEGQELTELLQKHMNGETPPLTFLTFSRFDEENNLIAVTTISAEEGNTSNLSFQHSKLNLCGESEDIHGSLNNCNQVPIDLFLVGDKLIVETINGPVINVNDGYGGDTISPSLGIFLSKAKNGEEIFNENELFDKLFSKSDGEFKEFSDWIKYSYLNSATARKLINHAAQDNTRWDVSRESKEFKSDLTNKTLFIPEDYSFKNSEYRAARYYLHELVHRCTSLPDKDGDHNSGPIVQLVNKIMGELGSDDVRLEYKNINPSNNTDIVGMFKINKYKILSPEQINNEATLRYGSTTSEAARSYISRATAESLWELDKVKDEDNKNRSFELLKNYQSEQNAIRMAEQEAHYQKQEAGKAALKSREREERDATMEQRESFNILTDIINPLSGYVNAFLDSLNTLTAKEMSTNIYSLTRLGDLLRS